MKKAIVLLTSLICLLSLSFSVSASIVPFPDLMGTNLEFDEEKTIIEENIDDKDEYYFGDDDTIRLDINKDLFKKLFITPSIILISLGVFFFLAYIAFGEIKVLIKNKTEQ